MPETGATNLSHVIVGGGLAAATAAETLRAEGATGRVVILGAEPHLPYDRPPLSKGYLLGQDGEEKVFLHDADFYASRDIEVRTATPVTAVDRSAAEVVLADGDRIRYDRLLLATGSYPRRLDVPGADATGVHYLRTLGDSTRLREVFRARGRVVVIGAGWIGLEGAAAAATLGAQVTIVEPAPTPLHGVLGPELGDFFAALHTDHGVTVRTGIGVEEIATSGGAVREVVCSDATRIPADAVLVGVGVLPADDLARDAGLEVEAGIRVSAGLVTTRDPAIFAAGDVMRADHPRYPAPVRVEHWATALNSGPAAARAMLGQPVVYDRVPYFFSDQFDLGMEFSGMTTGYEKIVYRGDVARRELCAFWVAGNQVLAGMNINVWDVSEPVQELIRSQAPVDLTRLADPSVPLSEVRR